MPRWTMHGEPLSRSLESLLAEEQGGGPALTMNQMCARTEGRGVYLMIVVLSMPFLIPVAVPGVSVFFGFMVGWLAFRLALGLPSALPRWLGDRPLPANFQHAVLRSGRRVLLWIERMSKPRRTAWLAWPAARLANCGLIIFLAFLLALPIPPVLPFTNTLPGVGILLLAVSMMEEDGVMIWFAYGAVGLTVIYFALAGGLIWTAMVNLFSILGS